jgi:hypothetical protein
MVQDWTEPNVCVDENLTTDENGILRIQPWAVPRLVFDDKGISSNDGLLLGSLEALPGKLLVEIKSHWRNDTPREAMLLVRLIRGSKVWVTSNPNAIQFRDRYTWIIDEDDLTPSEPVTTDLSESLCGSAIDMGTNSVAEPNPGRHWVWASANCTDRFIGPIQPGERINLWYQMYVWTPPPYSNNANKNAPLHEAHGRYARLQGIAFPQQGTLVVGSR